ncbi:MAG: PAAR domain-containing protein [Sciscionella sp.]
MPAAARVGDPTAHGGAVGPPGVVTVLISGLPAANVGTVHIPAACPSTSMQAPCELAFLPLSAIPTVLIGGLPALVQGSLVNPPCAASITVGAPTVLIGG